MYMHPAVIIPILASISAARIHARCGEIDACLHALSATEQDHRMAAQRQLMGLTRHELPLLRNRMATNRLLSPAISDPLEEIVRYIIVRDAISTLPLSKNGFLGVSQNTFSVTQIDERDRSVAVGIEVIRSPGTPAFRFLEEGDIIRAIGTTDTLKPMRTFAELRAFISRLSPGDTITLRIQRGPRTIDVTLPLDAKPADDDLQRLQTLLQEADQLADEYWQKNFAKLLELPSA